MNGSKFLLSSLCCCLLVLPGFAQQRITLRDALEQKKVRMQISGERGEDGQHLFMRLRNVTAEVLIMLIPAGQIFASADTSVQDQIVTKEQVVVLTPETNKSLNLYSMCTQSWNMSPRKGEPFRLGPMAEGGLLALAEKISTKNYQNSTAQSAVWSLINRESVRHIYGEDTAMVREIAQIVADTRGIPLDSFLLAPRPHRLTIIRTSLEALFDRPIERASLGLYNAAGMRIRSYFQNRNFEKGFTQFRVGANHYEAANSTLYLRLTGADGQTLMERAVTAADSVTPTINFHSQAVMTYEVPQDCNATIGVYDEQDRLFFLVKENHPLRQGHNRGTYIAAHPLPYGHTYYMKVKVDGQTLAEQALDPNAPAPVLYPKSRLSGAFTFKTPTVLKDAEIAIYSGDGEKRRVVYEIDHLNPGQRALRYQFEHFDGPDQAFYIRLTDASGKVVAEKCISCQ